MMGAFEQAFAESLQWIGELETAVSDAERALRACDWDALGSANAVQPRLMHGLRNALDTERPHADTEQNLAMNARIDRIVKVHGTQIDRILGYRNEVKARLIELSHFRKVAREAAGKERETSTFNVTR